MNTHSSARLLVGSLVAIAACFAMGSCSLITSFSECSVDADCPESQAVCQDEVCISKPKVATGATCQNVYGDVTSSNAFVVGVLLPLTGEEASFGIPLEKAIRLAFEDFEGLSGIAGRPLGLIVCDTEGLDDVALEAARHLIEVARVPAIIGPDFSSQTISIANTYAIPNQTLLVTPSGTAVTISDLADDNLIWRTCPSDQAQAVGLGDVATDLLSSRIGVEPDAATVWVFSAEGDAYGDGLRDALVRSLPADLVGSDDFIVKSYPRETWADAWFVETVTSLPDPDLVILLGASEAWDITEAIDEVVGNEPLYLFADAARNQDEAAVTAIGLEGRILGTAPQIVGDNDYQPYTVFRIKYRAVFDEDPDGFAFIPHAYDAYYVIALAAAAGGFTGPELAQGMAKLSDGEAVQASQAGAQRAMRILSEGKTVDFEGASGRVDFDEFGDPNSGPIVMWCFEDQGIFDVGRILSSDGTFTPLSCKPGTNSL